MVKPKSFRPWNPEQTLLLPPSPVDWLPPPHSPGTAICFCCTIEHAEQMAGAFRAAGIRAASVSGGTSAEDRKRLIAGLGTGEVEVLTSCMIISEGTDIPSVGGAILMRPTASLSLYLQMVGRALRPAPGKQEAVILDHVGNAHRHGLPTDERAWNLAGRRRREGVSIPIKDCPVCFCSCPSAAQVCPDCGHQFLAEERDEQRRGLQLLEGELVKISGSDRHRPQLQQARPRRPSSSCWSASRNAATNPAGPGMCGLQGSTTRQTAVRFDVRVKAMS
ncbi:hypothetical protein KBY74_10470 [Cyanobium sp. A1C-AMD]|uniref:DEAD/DEAH box helicase n=1 Tax=Cyanobium sp. A1C-AMD TaxID=2823694 RepID=UPI0020CE39B7|nr:helicase-related protein [Cyanobium sp. A1C-AMD]MCP9880273.1 hypothetical protein [Cyanobium sp. A1C-AMD]